ncbi:MAG: S8 family serine peptidase [Firmicutes bacterium]|nr:S8 family serine peptidase [Bacillota bacterium]
MKMRKRSAALLLSLLLLVGLFPAAAAADDAEASSGSQELAAQEVESSRLDTLGTTGSETAVPLYADDEYVTVIVEMASTPVLSYYTDSAYAVLDGETTAGEAVSAFLASDEAQALADSVAQSQEGVISEIAAVAAQTAESLGVADGFSVQNRWSIITNAMVIRVPYGALAEISELDGVKRAYVEHVYSLPDDTTTEGEYDAAYTYSLDLAGVTGAWAEGYTGLGMVIAVLDTGLDITWGITDSTGANYGVTKVHEAFTEDSFATSGAELYENLRWTSASMKYFVENTQLNSNTGSDGGMIIWDNNALYKNLKVPYACDYADGDMNVANSNSDNGSHGTHVSGTIAGYAATEEGEVLFSGVAPDAQILMMKIFGDEDSGAYESTIIMALEDSIKLGADAINLSLGSDNGFAEDDTIQNDVYELVEQAGIIILTSAGNSSDSDAGNNYGDESLASNPETSMISSPAVYDSNLAVASIENVINTEMYFTWVDADGESHDVAFTDYWSVAMKQKFSDGTYPIYYVSGTGTYSDYYSAGFRSYYGYGTKGVTGIALVERGELSFEDKINNATSFYESYYNSSTGSYVSGCPVLGVIIYDNDPESDELITMSVSNTTLTSAFISGRDGAEIVAALQSGFQVYMTVSSVDKTVANETAGEISSFSSWGASPSLTLKPEITAPGGYIWSSVPDTTSSSSEDYTGSYEMMSGTSMAAPHMTGISALVRQYVQTSSAFKGMSRTDVADVVKQLLVSTAVPVVDESTGAYYSPRQQGAGLVNATAAVTTPAYITVEGQTVGKLELSDDPQKTGEYEIAFTLKNISNTSVSYDVSVVLMRPATETAESYYGTEQTFMTDSDVVIKTVSLGTLTAAAGSSADFSQTVSLTAAEKAELNELFANGTYVEGFVILTDATGSGNPQLGLPMLAFYGDWTAAPIFDTSVWFVEPDSDYDSDYGAFAEQTTWGTSIVGSTIGTIGYLNLGENAFDTSTAEDGSDIVQYVYFDENFGISPNGDGYMDAVDDYILYQLRDARLIVVTVTDAQTGEVYMRDGASYLTKTIYSSSYGMALPYSAYGTLPTWDGTDLEGNVLPSGTQCIYTITAYGDGDYPTVWSEEDEAYVTDFESIINGEAVPTFNGHEMDMTGDVISFHVVVDTVAPKLENNTVSVYEVEEEDGTHVYMTGTVYDEDGSIANVEIYPYVCRSYAEGYGNSDYSEYGIDYLNTFYTENVYDAGTKTLTFTADVTEYVRENWSYASEQYYYQFTWTGNVIISCGDYAANDRSYAVTVDASEGLVLSQTSALLHITLDEDGNITEGASFELSVLDNTGIEEGEITRTSSNPDVATIDEFGHVEATGVGQTIITVSKGGASVICVVAVEATTNEVLDFELSITNFDTLTPDGQITVKVTNLQPADVVIESVEWLVYESDQYAEDYGAGLVMVSQNSSDGLEGVIYLNYNNCASLGVDEMPAGDGWLEVTINGVTRSMTFSWEDLYKTTSDDDLVSALSYADQTVYVTLGETATLEAKYNNTSLHSVGQVALYTAVGAYAYNYNYDNPTTEATGLVLDGQPYFNSGASWTGKLVNLEGYDLPASITVWTRGSDGYESQMSNYSWSTNYTYDSETGEIWVKNTPYTNTSMLVIRADGVENPDAEAGELSGTEWTMPDGLYGPFDWVITDGTGSGEEVIVTQTYGSDINAYAYTPTEPGVSYITATTKDGAYSLTFAVVCEPVRAQSIDLAYHSLTMEVGESFDPTLAGFVTLDPEPTLAEDAQVCWLSYDESIVKIGENGELIAVAAGDVYVKGYLGTDNTVMTYLIVHVNPLPTYTVRFLDWDGAVLDTQTVETGSAATAPADPSREGYVFTGWDVDFSSITGDLDVTAQYAMLYTITLDPNGGYLESTTISLTDGQAVGELPTPTKEGYTFAGWYDADRNRITPETIYNASADSTYYANWSANTYTLTLDSGNGESSAITVTYGEAIGELLTPTMDGYVFGGWVDANGNPVSADTIYTSALGTTLTAVWTEETQATEPETSEPEASETEATQTDATDAEDSTESAGGSSKTGDSTPLAACALLLLLSAAGICVIGKRKLQ